MAQEKSVRFYTTGTVTMRVHFPNGETVCHGCPYVWHDESLRQHRWEYLSFPLDGRGLDCPVILEEGRDDVIVYFLHHVDVSEIGKIRAKTVGKMIDSKLTNEIDNDLKQVDTAIREYWGLAPIKNEEDSEHDRN